MGSQFTVRQTCLEIFSHDSPCSEETSVFVWTRNRYVPWIAADATLAAIVNMLALRMKLVKVNILLDASLLLSSI